MNAPDTRATFERVRVDKIDVDAARNSRSGDPDVSDLLRSLPEIGLLEPIVVRTLPDGRYQLVSGYRRLRAMRELGWEWAPSMVHPVTDDRLALLMNLAENLVRKTLRRFDEVRAVVQLRTMGSTPQEIQSHTGLGVSLIGDYVHLWNRLTPEVKVYWSRIPERDWEPKLQTLREWSCKPADEQQRAVKLWANDDESDPDASDDDTPPEPVTGPRLPKVRKGNRRRSVPKVIQMVKRLSLSRDATRQAQVRALEWALGKRNDL